MSGSISFEGLAGVYDATRGGLERGRGFARDLAPFITGPCVLEIGVGTGAVALPLSEITGFPVFGVDISPAMLARAAARIGPRVALGDADHLPVRAGSVDTVVVVWVFQLVPDIASVMHQIALALRTGGRLAVVLSRPEQRTDDIDLVVRAMFERLGPRAPDGPHHIADLAGDAGLAVVARALTTEQLWDESPVQAAERLELRQFATLLNMTQARFEEVVLPAARELRALPDPDRPRHRANRHHYLVCEKVA